MKNQNHKDKNKRILNLKVENKKFILKSIIKNVSILKVISLNSRLKCTEMLNSYQSGVLVNRCILTGRNKRFNKIFKFSRLSFLKYARNGYINGLSKSSW